MKIFVVAAFKPSTPMEEIAPHIDETSDRVTEMYRDRIIREICTRIDGKGASLVLEARDEAEALDTLSVLLLAKLGLHTFEAYGAQAYRGFLRSIA